MLNVPYALETDAMGKIIITVLNELRAPTTCSSSIEALVYFGPGEDFELAVPYTRGTRNIVAQSGLGNLNQETLATSKAVGNSTVPGFNLVHSQFCIGELCTSIKMLISRAYEWRPSAVYGVSGSVYPWAHALMTYGSVTGTKLVPACPVDLIGELAAGYALYRGGINLYINPTGATDMPVRVGPSPTVVGEAVVLAVALSEIAPAAVYPTATMNAAMAICPSSQRQGASFKMPYYNRTSSSLNNMYVNGSTIPADISAPLSRMGWNGSATGTEILRSAAEDYQLGYFIGWGQQLTTYA